jgi:hypothetical protein
VEQGFVATAAGASYIRGICFAEYPIPDQIL